MGRTAPAAAPASASSAATAADGSLAPPRCCLLRFTSRLDESRASVAAGLTSPATFDRSDHRSVLVELQRGLEGMSAQRRAEEEHMRAATRVRPAKHPRGGVVYADTETGKSLSLSLSLRVCPARPLVTSVSARALSLSRLAARALSRILPLFLVLLSALAHWQRPPPPLDTSTCSLRARSNFLAPTIL